MTASHTTRRFEMVAVPRPRAQLIAKTSFALGVRSTQKGAAYVIGHDGPEHMPIEKLYFTAGDKEFELDLENATLTVADKAQLRVTIFPIDIDAMHGHVIEHGETFTVVMADDQRSERAVPVKRWVAATAPTFERDELPEYVTGADDIAVSISATLREAERAGAVKVRSFDTARQDITQQTTRQAVMSKVSISEIGQISQEIVDIREQPSRVKPEEIEEVIDLDEAAFDQAPVVDDGSVEVVIPDPVSGARYIGRQWRKTLAAKDALTLAALKATGYRVVILEMDGGKSATIALNDAKGLPVMSIATNSGKPVIDRFLTAETWDRRFSPNESFHFSVDSKLDGTPATERGDLSTPTVTRITGTHDLIRSDAAIDSIQVSNALANHRKRLASRTTKRDTSLVKVFSR